MHVVRSKLTLVFVVRKRCRFFYTGNEWDWKKSKRDVGVRKDRDGGGCHMGITVLCVCEREWKSYGRGHHTTWQRLPTLVSLRALLLLIFYTQNLFWWGGGGFGLGDAKLRKISPTNNVVIWDGCFLLIDHFFDSIRHFFDSIRHLLHCFIIVWTRFLDFLKYYSKHNSSAPTSRHVTFPRSQIFRI